MRFLRLDRRPLLPSATASAPSARIGDLEERGHAYWQRARARCGARSHVTGVRPAPCGSDPFAGHPSAGGARPGSLPQCPCERIRSRSWISTSTPSPARSTCCWRSFCASELELVEVPIATVVLAYLAELEGADEIDLESLSEFLVLVAALCELNRACSWTRKPTTRRSSTPRARPRSSRAPRRVPALQASGRLARRAPRRRRPARVPHDARAVRAAASAAPLVDEQPRRLAEAMLHLLEPPERVDTTTIRRRPSRCAVRRALRLLVRAAAFVFDDEVAGLERGAQAAAFVALLELISAARRAAQTHLFEPSAWRATRARCACRPGHRRDRGGGVSDGLVAACEALLFVASEPLALHEIAAAAEADEEAVEPPSVELERRLEERGAASCSTAPRRASACEPAPGGPGRGRQPPAAAGTRARPQPRGAGGAAVARTCSPSAGRDRPHPRRVVRRRRRRPAQRELIEEAGRGDGLGAPVLYRTTATFERIFGLDDGIGGLPASTATTRSTVRSCASDCTRWQPSAASVMPRPSASTATSPLRARLAPWRRDARGGGARHDRRRRRRLAGAARRRRARRHGRRRCPSLRTRTTTCCSTSPDVVTTVRDTHGRRTVIDLVGADRRLFPVGRLDAETTGLLLLTNDGELAARLMHPRHGVEKTYERPCAAP